VVTDRPGRGVCLERQNCVGKIWGSESKGTHISGDWCGGPCWAGARRRLHFLSVRGHTAQHATDLTPSLPETSYNAAFGSGVLCNAGLYESGYCEGGSLQYRHYDKPLQKTHAGLTLHHSRLLVEGQLTDRDPILESHRQTHQGHASRFLLSRYYAHHMTGQVPHASQTVTLRLSEPLKCSYREPGVFTYNLAALPCFPGRLLPRLAFDLLFFRLLGILVSSCLFPANREAQLHHEGWMAGKYLVRVEQRWMRVRTYCQST
jgi:hypothetical protein